MSKFKFLISVLIVSALFIGAGCGGSSSRHYPGSITIPITSNDVVISNDVPVDENNGDENNNVNDDVTNENENNNVSNDVTDNNENNTVSNDVNNDDNNTTSNDVNNGGGGSSEQSNDDNDTTLIFDSSSYTTGTVNGVSYRLYSDIVYVENPVNETYQQMDIYIPETYLSSGTMGTNNYTKDTAPIFMPNSVGGYMKGNKSGLRGDSQAVAVALSHGCVVAAPALRGRDLDSGGKAPACIVDYKAAVRYLKYNKQKGYLPAGNTDRIISSGTSAGGAISSLLGATGNSSDYDEYLDELGAVNASDDIYASMCYCPITNLDNADMAYEWVFASSSSSVSTYLKSAFTDYVNNLGLKSGDTELTLDSNGNGTFEDYIKNVYMSAAQKALNAGTSVNVSWLTIENGTVTNMDLSSYGSSRGKNQIPAFDRFSNDSAENNEFGTDEITNQHFTDYSHQNSTAGGSKADESIIKIMNPMNYIGKADNAKYWRIRHGSNDKDTSMAVPAILALALENNNCTVDFAAAWGEGHGGYYDSDEVEALFDWIDEICK